MILASNRPQPVYQVPPAYPLELMQEGIRGQAVFRISIDDEGNVRKARTVKALHPYLDSAAIQAIQQWRFEPVLKNGRAVAVSFDWPLIFNPDSWLRPEESVSAAEPPPSAELQRILALCAEYCRKLSGAALDFVCEETIKDTNFALYIPDSMKSNPQIDKTYRQGSDYVSVTSAARPLRPNPWKTEVRRYVCDYQMVKREGRFEERRTLLEENGRRVREEGRGLEEKRITALRPLFAPIRILATDRQPHFVFKLLKEDKLLGRESYVLEARPKAGTPGNIHEARIWIEKETCRVIRSEIRETPPEGYEMIIDEANEIGKVLEFTINSVFSIEKNGLFFPGEVEVLAVYPLNSWGYTRRTRLETDIRYDKYKFFMVNTESKVIE